MNRKHLVRLIPALAAVAVMVLIAPACNPPQPMDAAVPINPFTDLRSLVVGVGLQSLTSQITPLGGFASGEVLQILVRTSEGGAAYILKRDDPEQAAGVVIDGGPANEPFVVRMREDAQLFLFVDAQLGATVEARVNRVAESFFRRPASQTFVVRFDRNFLADGLLDPEQADDADRDILSGIEPVVREGIMQRLRQIYRMAPLFFLTEEDARPQTYSLLTFTSQRVNQEATLDEVTGREPSDGVLGSVPDAIAVDGSLVRVGCAGDGCPCEGSVDAGNRVPDDDAYVYVGNFRDLDPIFDSTNNIINALALTGAHEVGHLLGLNHTVLEGIMSPICTNAFQRQLELQRSQVVDDSESCQRSALTNVIQDPEVYFEHIFGQP